MNIPHLSADTDFNLLAEALDEAGCAVVTDAFDAARREAIRAELAPHMERARVTEKDDPDEFYPGLTRRVTALLARSRTVTDQLILHPVTKEICDVFLLPNGEFGYQLHVTAALEVGPGARKQVLHREEDSLTFFSLPRPNMIVASMWAVSDFRTDNGATLVVPGSHKWPADRVAQADEIFSAEMPAGSVFYWLGGLLHGAGANTSHDWRYGVILTYSVGWMRQEENQYLDVPPERLVELSPEVRRIAGFDMYRALGFHDPTVTSH
jgi:ectoine hydroxylase-related dioxygenase (phytanoyl-CoA dioxygenase family)